MVFPPAAHLHALASAEPFSLLRWALSLVGVPQTFLVELVAGLVLIATAYVGIASVTALIGIWAERKVAGRIQVRHGPNRVGPVGLLQSIADGVKLLTKED